MPVRQLEVSVGRLLKAQTSWHAAQQRPDDVRREQEEKEAAFCRSGEALPILKSAQALQGRRETDEEDM